jgi:hypothetical protein|tara:strand:- start:2204 stop:3031 length:828 start_codon:yes stop_codon:yes gene_type:complete
MTVSEQSVLQIRELEISITARCTLACDNCGFVVPHQPTPYLDDPITEISDSLTHLHRAGVRIASLAILGGEPTIDRQLLETVLRTVASIGIAERIEVVTNGLTPRGLSRLALHHINRLSVSVYGLGAEILDLYRTWIGLVAPHVELIFRESDDGWDPWAEGVKVSQSRAQAMFDDCWYRRHCTTLERGRLFVCSRVAKLARDEEGLAITSSTTINDLRSYLSQPVALPSCATCTPMMGLDTVPAGVQPDDRIPRLEAKAVAWLTTAISTQQGRIV